MNLRDFRRAGHAPTLLAAFLYFDVSFMVWVLIGALGNSIADDFGLTAWQKGFMVAVPLLGGALLRPVMGLLTDQIGARRTGLIGLTLTLVPLGLGWLWADSFAQMLVVGLLLGVAGASFAAALPLASRWYPPQYQGLALGIAGAGNSGTALATFFGPRLAESLGWHAVFGLALLPIAAVLAVFALIARDAPDRPAPKGLAAYAGVIGRRDAWWFCAFYAVTFGGFVGLASFLPIFFRDQYALGKVTAGNFATLCVISGSFLRPVGGYLADRFGGARVLIVLFATLAAILGGVAALPPLAQVATLLFLGMAALGMGNGAVFQLVPGRFPREIGVVTGLVGAIGGLGGFALPNMLGVLRQASGHYGGGFAAFALTALAAAVAIAAVGRQWHEDSVTTFTVLDDDEPLPTLEPGLEGAA
jgi:NNP family nitrate/nitrite transporter-like MFS transporter